MQREGGPPAKNGVRLEVDFFLRRNEVSRGGWGGPWVGSAGSAAGCGGGWVGAAVGPGAGDSARLR